MRQVLTYFFLTILISACMNDPQNLNPGQRLVKKEVPDFEDFPIYVGKDLGMTYGPSSTSFKVWAPSAEALRIKIYDTDFGGEALEVKDLEKSTQGIWKLRLDGDYLGKYYTFQAKHQDTWLMEVPDPYVLAVGSNGKRGMIVDMEKTNPEGWANDQRPPLKNPTDIILYELHVRDLSIQENSGITHKGKFLGLTETGTKSAEGEKTGLDHIKDLGVTHVHLLPTYDFYTVDETRLDEPQFNWGYDPQNYNTPEGSYATNPNDGAVRIREFKQMVKTLHDNGLRVIMDVVYNHTGVSETSNFNQLVPGYYYRQDTLGGFSNASGCGNETASEREMMRKFILESVEHWVKEYHVDGFRFDLMGIHDIETMNLVSERLHAIDSSIFIYGEGWTAGDSPLPGDRQAIKHNNLQLKGVAAFSDDLRDGLKGSVFVHDEQGFVSGKIGREESVKFGVVAATKHSDLNYGRVNYSKAPWAPQPAQCINYVSCHDNHTLWDRLKISNPDADEAEMIRMHTLAQTIVLTAQGVPFLHAGTEMLRTKGGDENSYKSSDAVNQLDWARKKEYKAVYEYYKNLIQLRKNHPAFRMTSEAMIQKHLSFLKMPTTQLVGYTINGNANGDSWNSIVVLYNGNNSDQEVEIPKGIWTVVLKGNRISEKGLGAVMGDKVTIPKQAAMILMQVDQG